MAEHYVRSAPKANVTAFALTFIGTIALSQFDPVIFRLHIVYWIAPFLMAALIWTWLPLKRPPYWLYLIGLASYSLYLLHPVAIAMTTMSSALLSGAAAFVLSLILSAFSYKFIEVPGVAANKALTALLRRERKHSR